jgi:hypothetical protein
VMKTTAATRIGRASWPGFERGQGGGSSRFPMSLRALTEPFDFVASATYDPEMGGSTIRSATAMSPRTGSIEVISTSASSRPTLRGRPQKGAPVGNRTHNASIPGDVLAELSEHAKSIGLQPATIVRRVVEEYAQGTPEPRPARSQTIKVKYRTTDDAFNAAQARAAIENRSLSEAITIGVQKLLAS